MKKKEKIIEKFSKEIKVIRKKKIEIIEIGICTTKVNKTKQKAYWMIWVQMTDDRIQEIENNSTTFTESKRKK